MGSNLIGRVLENQFRVDAFVDSGAMGAVYKVWDLKRNVPLAMKVLHVDLADDPSMLKHFRREANALRKLTHPNIVPFYGLFQTQDFTFLLEYFIDGISLKDTLRKQHGDLLPLLTALTTLKALCAALGYAHLHGVVHCDVKPGNVMVDRGGQIFLTDFGIARHAESTTTTLASVGTTAYMAPEQIRAEPVSAATDIYALGVILFEMLTGQRPFRGSDGGGDSSGATAAERIRYAHLHLAPPNPQNLNPSLPDGLAIVVLKALAKIPEMRYQNANQMLTEAISAAGLQYDQVPDRLESPAQAPVNEAAALAAVAVAPLAKQPIPALAAGVPADGAIPVRRDKPRHRLNAWLLGLAVILLGIILFTATGNASNIFTWIPFFRPQGDGSPRVVESQSPPKPVKSILPTRVVIKTPRKSNPSPTQSRKASTRTPIPPTRTPFPRTRTPIPPTPTPLPVNPVFTALEDMFCREGPGQNYEPHVTILNGEALPVLRKWGDGEWILVGIDRSDTRTKCCWVGGEGSMNVATNSLLTIDYLPDRIRCVLNP